MKSSRCRTAAFTLIPALILYAGHSGAFEIDSLSGRLVVTGSSTVAPLIGDIAKRFESLCADCRIDVQSGGSSRGIADVRKGLADVGMVSRDLNPAEDDLDGHPLVRDGIAMIVNPSAATEALDDDQIRRIYTGEIESWDAVGGAEEQITVVNKAEGRSTLDVFLDYTDLEIEQIEPDVVIGENEQGIKYVSTAPGSIGYVSIGAALYAVEIGLPLKVLPLGPVDVTIENIAKGDYSAVRALNLVTSGEVEDLAQAFIDYASSEEVWDLVESYYFVPITH
ncbi:MAG: phosphate ABC transporter substrate-binding protein [Geminicoccaceae bacterium]